MVLLHSVLGSRKLAFGKSQDGEGGALLGKWTRAGFLNSLVGHSRRRMLGCEPQKNKWHELVREDVGMEKNG